MPHKWIYGLGFGLFVGIRSYHLARQGRQQPVKGNHVEKTFLFMQLVGMQILPLTYLFSKKLEWADYDLPHPIRVLGNFVGAGAAVGAAYLLHRAHADLGHNWRAELQAQPDQTLVTSGIYSHMRHPMYAAHWLWALAQALLLPNRVAGPALLLTFWPFYHYRVVQEEAQMRERFGEQYNRYTHKVGRLF